MKPHRLAVYGLTAGLLGGGAAGLALTGTTLASTRIADVTSADSSAAADPATGTTTSDSTGTDAGETTTTTAAPAADDPTTTSTAPAATPAPAAAAPSTGAAKPAPGADWAKAALDPLVANGTITQAQEDAVLAALKTARPDHGPGHGRGPGGPGFGNLDAAAKALGMTADELRTALQGGKSLADVAKSKGVDPAKVVDALVAELKAHLDAEVKSGEHTQAQADEILAQAKTRIEAFVNGTAPAGGPGGFGFGGGHGHGGPGGFGGPAPADGSGAPAAGTTTS